MVVGVLSRAILLCCDSVTSLCNFGHWAEDEAAGMSADQVCGTISTRRERNWIVDGPYLVSVEWHSNCSSAGNFTQKAP